MQALEEALQETARMSDLVDSLLTLARADEGRFDLHREPVALGPLVRDVYETAVILGEHAGQTVTMSVLEEAMVDGDARRLRQLFLNLITNAIKYTGRDGKVELSLSRRVGDEVAFTVRDTGIGISAADLPYVFDRFWRADRARSRGSERSGLRARTRHQPLDRAGARRPRHGAVAPRTRLRVHCRAADARRCRRRSTGARARWARHLQLTSF